MASRRTQNLCSREAGHREVLTCERDRGLANTVVYTITHDGAALPRTPRRREDYFEVTSFLPCRYVDFCYHLQAHTLVDHLLFTRSPMNEENLRVPRR